MLGKFIAGDFIAIAGEMCRFLASNENTGHLYNSILQTLLTGLLTCCLDFQSTCCYFFYHMMNMC